LRLVITYGIQPLQPTRQPIERPHPAPQPTPARPSPGASPMSAGDKVVVTGASGFVGSAVARKLLQRGFAVRALVRPTSPRFHLAGLDIAFVEGDLLDPATVRPAMEGVRHVFHVAADYRLWARDPTEIIRNNVDSTRNVMEAALRAGVERVVYTSSVATLAVRRDGTSVDETFPLDEAKAIGAYKRSKVAAER